MIKVRQLDAALIVPALLPKNKRRDGHHSG